MMELNGDAPHGLVAEIVELTRVRGRERVGSSDAEKRELCDFGNGVGDVAALVLFFFGNVKAVRLEFVLGWHVVDG